MSTAKQIVDRVITVAAAVAAPVLTTLVDSHVLAAATATDLGAVVTAFVAAWHGGSALTARAQAAEPVTPDGLV